MLERAVYVHIPFCVTKCGYCDFLSYPGQSEALKEEILTAIIAETKSILQDLPELRAKSLYIGGGTPTCLSGGQIYGLLDTLREMLDPLPGAEITVEGNPGTLNREKLKVLHEVGCNRLSLGVQSFNPSELQRLGRIHGLEEVYNTYDLARKAGFSNINLDLMYGLPDQDMASWRHSLRCATELNPEHISLYQLNLEEGTPFYRDYQAGKLREFDQAEALAMYEEAIETSTSHGYVHYEVSNFARPGFESRHNKSYWRNEEYLGLGPGASGYLQGIRYKNLDGLQQYMEKVGQKIKPWAEEERIDRELAIAETMFLGLRLLAGVSKDEFLRRFGIPLEEKYASLVKDLIKRGLLENTTDYLRLTRQGLYQANEVIMDFLP